LHGMAIVTAKACHETDRICDEPDKCLVVKVLSSVTAHIPGVLHGRSVQASRRIPHVLCWRLVADPVHRQCSGTLSIRDPKHLSVICVQA
jgi:hypothetical protein